jgi:AraC-like DNA-binding protein
MRPDYLVGMPARATLEDSAGPHRLGGLSALLKVCRSLEFEPHDIASQLDDRGRYEVTFEREFPLHIKLFHYTSKHHTRGATWHERLELFTPLDGPARFRMGSQDVVLERGDVLVVDNLKLHHVVDFPGFNTRVIVISFMPEFVFSLGSPSHDYTFLQPFYSRLDHRPHVLRGVDAAATPVHVAMALLLERYASAHTPALRPAGCKAAFLELLYHLARHFHGSEVLKWEFLRQQERSMRLKPLFDHLSRNYASRLSVAEAAAMVHMSQPQFMKVFKKVAGTTLVAYLNHVRLSNGVRLLRETRLTIAEIAAETGFFDQSYFDRRFKRAFGTSPREYRERLSRKA